MRNNVSATMCPRLSGPLATTTIRVSQVCIPHLFNFCSLGAYSIRFLDLNPYRFYSNARRFYSSMGNPLDGKGLRVGAYQILHHFLKVASLLCNKTINENISRRCTTAEFKHDITVPRLSQ